MKEIGDVCKKCQGIGRWTDAECGDISYTTYTCKYCNGTGGTGIYPILLRNRNLVPSEAKKLFTELKDYLELFETKNYF